MSLDMLFIGDCIVLKLNCIAINYSLIYQFRLSSVVEWNIKKSFL